MLNEQLTMSPKGRFAVMNKEEAKAICPLLIINCIDLPRPYVS
jgi:hypothetical protein